jgi:hypothetical protein
MAGLRSSGVGVVPEPFGLDEDGREVVEYVAGDCPVYPLPSWAWGDAALRQVGAALRSVHDASASLDLPLDGWRRAPIQPVEVVCHGDVAPYNTVWRDGRLVAFIDWDYACPGPRGWDLGYAAYRFVPLTSPRNPDVPVTTREEQRRRLEVLCEAYGGADPDDVHRWALARVDDLLENGRLHRTIYLDDAEWLRGG